MEDIKISDGIRELIEFVAERDMESRRILYHLIDRALTALEESETLFNEYMEDDYGPSTVENRNRH